MLSSISSSVVTVLLVFSFVEGLNFDSSIAPTDVPSTRQPKLSAITVRSGLISREESFKPKHDCVHHYAEASPSLNGGRTRVAKTVTKYKLPALALEDIEMVLKDIICSDSSVTVQFPDRHSLDDIRPSWDNIGAFFLISSHAGCNEDGERLPHLVTGIQYDTQIATATFATTRAEWRDAYKSMTVKFGSSTNPFSPDSFRTHEGLRRRADPVSSTTSSSPQPSSSDLIPNVHFDLATISNNSEMLDPNQVLYTYNATTNGIDKTATLSCKDCTINGIIDIEDGEFHDSNELTPWGEVVDFYNDGYIRASVNNLTAHIGIQAILGSSIATNFSKELVSITLPGFEIPNIVSVGPKFRPVFTASIDLKAALDFSYGFEIKVPDNSSIIYNIKTIQNSTTQGFSETTLTPLPFQATSPNITLGLSASLRPELAFGIDFLGGAVGSIDAAVFLDLPSATLNISTVPDLDENCKPITTSIGQAIPYKFPSLVLVNIEVILDIGVSAEGEVNMLDIGSFGTETETILTATTLDVASTCLSFDASKKSLVKPTPPPTSTAGAGGTFVETNNNKTDSKKNNGNKARGDPAKSLWLSEGGLMAVFFLALAL